MLNKQSRLRALRRLTHETNDLLYHEEFMDTIIDMRSRLGIDVDILKGMTHDSLTENELAGTKLVWDVVHARMDALAKYLLSRRLISQYSARALERLIIYPSSGKFWETVGEAYKLDYPKRFALVPYEHIVGGLCFDITEYPRHYNEAEFYNVTNQLWEVTKEGYIIDNLPAADLEEYLLFCMYIKLAKIGSRLIYYEEGIFGYDENYRNLKVRGTIFRTLDTWRKYISNYIIDEYHIYLDVSTLSLDDIALYWPQVEIAKEQVGVYEWVPLGRTKGTKQSRKSGLGITWQELRKQIRENPKDLNKLWNEYVNKFGRESPLMRRRARDNFYKQIIVHPDMLDLKLQIRKRGRPRKSTTE